MTDPNTDPKDKKPMNTTDKKKHMGIGKKSIITIILFMLLINTLMCLSGSLVFDKAIEKIYNERGYVVANIILQQIDHDKIAEYARTWTEDSYYNEMSEYLQMIQECSDAAYIYIGVPYEDKTIKYIYDSGSEMGFVDPISAPFEKIWRSYTEGVRPDDYLVRHSQYGFLTSSCLPIKDSSGSTAALLFVDTNMDVILSTLHRYVLTVSCIAMVLLIVFSTLNWYFMNKYFIDPIMAIRKNVLHFASNNAENDNTLERVRTRDELEELAVSVNKMENDIARYIEEIRTVTAEKERIGAELDVARQIQADMLPGLFPPYPDRKEFDIYASMTPAKEVGGDFYDFFFIDHDHIAIIIADVSGKGVPAALFMVIAKTLIKYRSLTEDVISPAAILKDVNGRLCEGNEAGFFVTVWLGIIEISTGKGIASNAGHERPAVRRKQGSYDYVINKHSPAVAAMEDTVFTEHEFKLEPGDSFFIYTDGVLEATNADVKMFGPEQLLDALNELPDADAETLLKNVKNKIDGFVGDAPQFDDITMLEFRYFGEASLDSLG